MDLKANVEWSKQGLSPERAVEAWATAATTSVILSVLIEERLATDGKVEVDGKTIIAKVGKDD